MYLNFIRMCILGLARHRIVGRVARTNVVGVMVRVGC